MSIDIPSPLWESISVSIPATFGPYRSLLAFLWACLWTPHPRAARPLAPKGLETALRTALGHVGTPRSIIWRGILSKAPGPTGRGFLGPRLYPILSLTGFSSKWKCRSIINQSGRSSSENRKLISLWNQSWSNSLSFYTLSLRSQRNY